MKRPENLLGERDHAVNDVATLKNKINRMSNRSYAEINFHITWHTKDNLPFITQKLEPDLYAFIKNRIVAMPNVYFQAIGGSLNTFISPLRSIRRSR